ncbi:MAG: hypothetical protein ACK4V2_03930 [Pseudomonadota bacterium]|jgi:hypothetical protein|nr:hypothetical protein [Alphaproteobacteria bacterium]
MKKQLRLLATAAALGSCLQAATQYIVGQEFDSVRVDTVRVGTSGGFHGYQAPSAAIKTLIVNFVSSGGVAERNTIQTNAYTGSGPVPYLPASVKQLYITGNASDYATLVLGNSDTLYAELKAPCAYALITPAASTAVRFALQEAPSSSPATWFQSPLLANCAVTVEPSSQDPWLEKVVPMNGGNIIIGSPVAIGDDFSTQLSAVRGTLQISRHPSVTLAQASTQAVATLTGDLISPYPIYGISIDGAYDLTFNGTTTSLVDVTSTTAGQKITVSAGKTAQVVYNQLDKPEFSQLDLKSGAYFNANATAEKTGTKFTLPKLVTNS